jgi:hypothetical protein
VTPTVEHLLERLRDAEGDLVREATAQQRRWQYRIRRGRVWFDEEVRRAQRAFRQSVPVFVRDSSVGALLTTPVIYSLLIPFAVLDLWVTVYQRICFPVYGITRVARRRYIVIDHHTLAYLNGIEKANCVFCSYATGVIAYVREVAARTEQYWCPIKHARAIPSPHARYRLFFDYGDAKTYRSDLPRLRRRLRPMRRHT